MEYINKELQMWIENDAVIIRVIKGYEYDASIQGLGKESDHPGDFSMWAWVNHLRGKRWWNEMNEKKFIELAKNIIKKNG